MSDVLDDAIKQLKDPDAGWVSRRDAAELLGKITAKAVDALQGAANESDRDVRQCVQKALGSASAALKNVKPSPSERAYTLDELVKACERPPKRVVSASPDGFDIMVSTKEGRAQHILVTPFKRSDGENLIRVYTRCGAPKDDPWRWALETNMDLTSGALAITEENGQPILVITKCFIASQTTPQEIKTAVKELAHYGDWIEQKLTDTDVH